LCQKCAHTLQLVPSRCYRCHKLTDSFRTCTACRKTSNLYRLQVGTIYTGSAKTLVWRLKFAGAQAAAQSIGEILSRTTHIEGDYCVVPVPTATSRVRRRGYDQAKLLARQHAKRYGLPYSDCLARSGQAHQVGARRQQRLKQLSSAFRVKTIQSVQDAHIILIDDVVTTGASLEMAAACLRRAGAKRVEAIVFAQA
jgi:ComF family protein